MSEKEPTIADVLAAVTTLRVDLMARIDTHHDSRIVERIDQEQLRAELREERRLIQWETTAWCLGCILAGGVGAWLFYYFTGMLK